MAKCGFFKAMIRVNTKFWGYLSGGVITEEKLLCKRVNFEKNQVVAYEMGFEDVILSRENVASIDLLEKNVKRAAEVNNVMLTIKMRPIDYQNKVEPKIDKYSIKMKDGKEGFLYLWDFVANEMIATILQ